MKIEPCPNPKCGGSVWRYTAPNIQCVACGVSANIDIWNSLPRLREPEQLVPNSEGWWWLMVNDEETPVECRNFRAFGGRLCAQLPGVSWSPIEEIQPPTWLGPCLREPAPERLALEEIQKQMERLKILADRGAYYTPWPETEQPINQFCCECGFRRTTGHSNTCEVGQALSATPAKQPEAKAGPWVSCKDRMPADRQHVLVKSPGDGHDIRWRDEGAWWAHYHSSPSEPENYFTHWMPIPPLEASSQPTLDDSKARVPGIPDNSNVAALREIRELCFSAHRASGYADIAAICDRALAASGPRKIVVRPVRMVQGAPLEGFVAEFEDDPNNMAAAGFSDEALGALVSKNAAQLGLEIIKK